MDGDYCTPKSAGAVPAEDDVHVDYDARHAAGIERRHDIEQINVPGETIMMGTRVATANGTIGKRPCIVSVSTNLRSTRQP